MDVLKSQVTDPGVYDKQENPPQTAWRIDRMKNMTYTQFWQLVKERRVDKVTHLPAASLSLCASYAEVSAALKSCAPVVLCTSRLCTIR